MPDSLGQQRQSAFGFAADLDDVLLLELVARVAEQADHFTLLAEHTRPLAPASRGSSKVWRSR